MTGDIVEFFPRNKVEGGARGGDFDAALKNSMGLERPMTVEVMPTFPPESTLEVEGGKTRHRGD